MNNTIEKENGSNHQLYLRYQGVYAMSMNSEDKNTFASFHIRQGLGITLTFISLGLIISNFDSLLMLPCGFSSLYFGRTASSVQ
jgi:hypothetical protein